MNLLVAHRLDIGGHIDVPVGQIGRLGHAPIVIVLRKVLVLMHEPVLISTTLQCLVLHSARALLQVIAFDLDQVLLHRVKSTSYLRLVVNGVVLHNFILLALLDAITFSIDDLAVGPVQAVVHVGHWVDGRAHHGPRRWRRIRVAHVGLVTRLVDSLGIQILVFDFSFIIFDARLWVPLTLIKLLL